MPDRHNLYTILDGTHARWGRPYALFTNTVIVVAVAVYAFSTMPGLSQSAILTLQLLEVAVIAVFAGDYFLRLACSPKPLAYATSFWGIVDLIAFLPALVLAGSDLTSARILRLIQLARVLKLMRLANALDQMLEALGEIRDQLLIFLILTLIVLFLSAVGIYQFEHRAQPDVFVSVPHALWWSVATLSTVGYGDIYP
ncbi:MAG: ion transporter, partial [Pseudomonadota bacterium]